MSDEPVYHRDGETFVPTAHARGPWDASAQHGGGPSALVAREIQALAPSMQLAQLSSHFLGPVPMAPLTVSATVLKPGRRLLLAEATVASEHGTCLVSRATLLRRAELDVPAGAQLDDTRPPVGPDAGEATTFPQVGEGFHTTAMDIRFVDGTSFAPGPGRVWFRLARELVAGEAIPPVCRAVAASDFGNGVSGVLSWDDWLFANCDLTTTLLRDPVGEWVALDARTQIDPTGIGRAASAIADERGGIGFAQQTLIVERSR